jgi:hypothetical protein
MNKDDLLTEASVIQGETATGANTANRIGQMFTDIINNVQVTEAAAEPYYQVDLSAGAYAITTNGIYEIVGVGNAITFPNPSNYVGQQVILLNTTGIDAGIDGSRPLSINNENEYDNIVGGNGMILISTGNRWVLISQI